MWCRKKCRTRGKMMGTPSLSREVKISSTFLSVGNTKIKNLSSWGEAWLSSKRSSSNSCAGSLLKFISEFEFKSNLNNKPRNLNLKLKLDFTCWTTPGNWERFMDFNKSNVTGSTCYIQKQRWSKCWVLKKFCFLLAKPRWHQSSLLTHQGQSPFSSLFLLPEASMKFLSQDLFEFSSSSAEHKKLLKSFKPTGFRNSAMKYSNISRRWKLETF